MSRALLIRALAAAAVALPLVGAAAAPAAADHPVPATEFFADHSRACDYAYTEGTIEWNPAHAGEAQRVDVTGVLVDEPVVCAPPTPSPGSPFAEFTAYVRNQEVDMETVYLEGLRNAKGEFKFSLFNTTGLPTLPIDRVDLRVCRTFGPMLPAFTCGDVESYRPPQIGPAD